jgi:D-alanyl-D-alanine carboxypeptidase
MMQQSPLRTTRMSRASTILLASLLACGEGKAPSREAAVPPPPAAPTLHAKPVNVDDLDSLIRAHVRQRNVVGLSVGVVQDGKVILARGYGVRSLESRDSVTPETMFAVGSVTKQFTCGALLLLAQEKKLSLDDRVAKYLPQLTRSADITLLDLGQHVSGYRDYYPLDFVDREMLEPQSADSIIAEYAKRPLDFEPGTRWSYSNTGFLILGQVVQKVSGQPLGEFLTQRFFTPLGMPNTRFDPPSGGDRMAIGYTSFALSPAIPATPEGAGWAGAAGAIWSTPTDLLAWDLSLLDRKVLTEESYRTLTTPRRMADGRSSGYGCGEFVNERGDAVVIRHGGAVSGFLAQNTIIPATRSAVVLLTNSDYAPLDELDTAIVRRLVPKVDVPEIHGPLALDAARAFLTALQQGQVDRSTLGEDFNAFLTPELVATAHASLGRLGKITDLRVETTVERGGMEVAILHFKVGQMPAQAYMYRTPDGKIQELLIARE